MVGRYRNAVARLVAPAVLAGSLVAVVSLPVAAQENACPLTKGIVLNANQELWAVDHAVLVSDGTLNDATRGPQSAAIPAGRYSVTLASYDDHAVVPDPPQDKERWVIQGFNGSTLVYTSPPIDDLPDNQNTLTQTVDADVVIPVITAVSVVHANFPDVTSPNSIFPVCVSFERLSSPIGLVDPATGIWYLREGKVEKQFFYGNPGDFPFMGDWDCDGTDTPGLYRQSDGFAYLRHSNSQGNGDIRFFFGNPGDIPLAGDFNNDGCDTLSIYRPSQARFYIINELGSEDQGLGAADYSFLFGNFGDKPVVGDWDGDGTDEIGLHRESSGLFYFRNTLSTGNADGQFFFGNPGDRFVAGDWGIVDGKETPAVFRPGNATWYFRHTNTQGPADELLQWGSGGWLQVAGNFTLP